MNKASYRVSCLLMQSVQLPEKRTKRHKVWRISLTKRVEDLFGMRCAPRKNIGENLFSAIVVRSLGDSF